MRLNNVWTKMVSLYLCSFLIVAPVLAEPPAWDGAGIVTLNEGETAPFTGTLFSVPAAAQLMVELEYTQTTCQIEIDRELESQAAKMQLEIDSVTAELVGCRSKYTEVIEIKDGQINFLDEQLKRSRQPNTPMWFAIGIASGILLTATAGWTMGQISNTTPSN